MNELNGGSSAGTFGSMRIPLLVVWFVAPVLFAAEPSPQAIIHDPLPWIPTNMDDWAALKAEAAAFQAGASKQHESFVARRTERLTSWVWLPPAVKEFIPTSDLGDDLVGISFGVHVNQQGQSCGETGVWRGADGKAMGAVIEWQPLNFRQRDPGVFLDLNAAATEFRERVARHAPAQIPWTIHMDPQHAWWIATWQRPNARLATIDERRGAVDALREVDMAWLSTPPAAKNFTPPSLSAASINSARMHPEVDAALLRFSSGYPMHPVVIQTTLSGGQTEKLGWKIGDVLTAFNGQRITGQRNLIDLCWEFGDFERTIRMTRLGGSPIDCKVAPGKIGFMGRDLPEDPGMEVLALAEAQCPQDLPAIALIWYAYSDQALRDRTLTDLSGKIPVAIEHLLKAWLALAESDDGAAYRHLAEESLRAEKGLTEVTTTLMTVIKGRSGRLLWAFPNLMTDNTTASMLRHLIATIPPAERFTFLDKGVPLNAWSTDGKGEFPTASGSADNALRAGHMTLSSALDFPLKRIAFEKFPARCDFRATMTLRPLPQVITSSDGENSWLSSEPRVLIGFNRCSSNQMSPAGCGQLCLAADHALQIAIPSLDLGDFPTLHSVAMPVPVPVLPAISPAATTSHHLRIIRWDHQQRFELNGKCVLQGFLPIPSSLTEPETFSLYLEVDGAVVEFTDIQVFTPSTAATPSNF